MSEPSSAPRVLTPQELYQRAADAEAAGRPDEAERLTRLALLVSGAPQMMRSLAIVLQQQGRFEDATDMQKAVTWVTPEDATAKFALAFSLLRAGDYEEGFRLYEMRQKKITAESSGPPVLSFPEWRGEPVRSLVVLPEQGLGDELMFNRYIPVLKARGIQVALLCRPSMARVFEPLGVKLVPLGPSVDVPLGDAWVFASSLPHLLGTRLATVPQPVYLPGAGAGRGVGVMSEGRKDPDPCRSLPPELAAELLALPGAVDLDPRSTGAADFEDTRRIIEGLDLVITIDTAVAHLAGAMGKACWTLIPFVHDWRWGKAGERSPWYPQMRLFRQPRPNDWASVIAEVTQAFAART